MDGGAGNDTLKLNAVGNIAALPAGVTYTGIETLNVRGTGTVAVDSTTGFTGLTTLKSTLSTTATLTAAATTAISVSGATGNIAVNGGSTQTITTAAGDVDANTAAGAVAITHTGTAGTALTADNGTSITINASGITTGGSIVVGATKATSGAVVVNATGKAYALADAASTMGTVAVTGDTTINVAQLAHSTTALAAGDVTTVATVTQGGVTITADNFTTSVTSTQSDQVTAVDAVAGVAAVAGTKVVTFTALANGEVMTVDGLVFTANKALTAAEVASAFSNLTSSDTQSAGGSTANGTYTIASNAQYTTGAASGAVVTYTEKVPGTSNAFTAVNGGAAANPTIVAGVTGVAATSAKTGVAGVVGGAVVIDDNATKSITTITVDGAATATLGGGSSLDALTTLSLANIPGATNLTTTATTLGLTLKDVDGAIDLGVGGDSITALNVTTDTTTSTTAIDMAATTALTVAGNALLNATGSTLTALKTITVSGSAGLTVDASGATVTSVNASATSGANTITVDATKATYTGGSGVDKVTTSAVAPTKAIALGAGDDTLTLFGGTTSSTGILSGGTGTNTLVMAAADAETASATAGFGGVIDSFQTLSLQAVATTADNTVNLANLDNISNVVSIGTADTAFVIDTTITGVTDNAADTVTIVVDGVTYTSAAAIYANGTAIAAALVTAINAGTGTQTASSAGAVLKLTADNAGETFSVGAIAGVSGGGAADTVTKVDDIVSSELILTNMTNAGTLTLNSAGVGATVTMTDATGSTDSLNVTVTNAASVNAGTVAAAGVETININADDILTTTAADAVHTLGISDAAVKTINVTGDAAGLVLNYGSLVANAAVALTKVDATAFAGALTASTNGTVAQTILGGAGKDVLTASGTSDILNGGAGNDTLHAGDLAQLTGGAGADTFNMTATTGNVNSYATILDPSSGDIIDANAGAFKAAAITLAGTAVFQDYANAAVNSTTAANDIVWFQFSGNTYVIQDAATGGAAYNDAADTIIQLAGLIDLSTASFNATQGTIEIA